MMDDLMKDDFKHPLLHLQDNIIHEEYIDTNITPLLNPLHSTSAKELQNILDIVSLLQQIFLV